jgi:hypothetical protein
MGRADEHNISHSGRDQLDPAQNESPHQDLAEFGVSLHQSQHAPAIQFDHLTDAHGTQAKERPTAGERTHFAGKLPRSIHHHKGFSPTRGTHNLQFARDHYKKRYCVVSLFDEYIARFYRTRVALGCNPTKLGRRQCGEYLLNAGAGQRQSADDVTHTGGNSVPEIISQISA